MEKSLEPILFCDIYYINVCNHVIEKNYCIIVKRVVDFFHFENEVYLNQQLLCLFLFIFIVLLFFLAEKWRVLLRGESPDYIHATFIHVRYVHVLNSLFVLCLCSCTTLRMV